MTTKYASRKWLNTDKKMTAFISVEFDVDEGFIVGETNPYDFSSASVSIADCSRIVTLDLPTNRKKHRKASLKKLEILITELMKLQDAIYEEYPDDE